MDIDRAWVIGNWDAADPLVQVWTNIARAHRVVVERTPNIPRAISKLTAHSLVLFRLGDDVVEKALDAMCRAPARVVYVIPPGDSDIAPTKAIKMCQENALSVVRDRENLPASLGKRLQKVYAGKGMYPVIPVRPWRRAKPEACFLVSSYSEEGDKFQVAARTALEARGIRINDPRDQHASEYIGGKVFGLIDDSDFIIADTRTPKDGANANVWLEVGVGIGKGQTIVFAHAEGTRSGSDSLPSDLRGHEYLGYWDYLDLTMKLYWGFCWVTHNGCP